jgi:transposase
LKLTFKKEIRKEVFGKRGTGITWGMRNCARHIPSTALTLAEMEERVKEEWGKVPYRIKADAVEQALLAYKTNFEKRKKQRERGEPVKPFNVQFRKYGQMSVINLPKKEVLVEFVRCEKKEKKKPKKKKKSNKKGKKKSKKKKKRTRTDDNENSKVYFFAKFSNVGDWCRSMREDGKAESGVRLCASKKVADLVLANNGENVLQTRLRYSKKRKHYFIDVVIKAPRTKADKAGVKRVGAIDLGVNPLYTVHTSEGVTIAEDAKERKKLFKLKAKCEHLVDRIAKRNFANQHRRTKQQYDRTTKRLRLKLERMRVSLQNFRTKWHHVEAKKIFEHVDVLILNRLGTQKILHESKQSHDGLGTKARKNMQTEAPAMFADKIEWRCRNIEGKKIVTGCGEKGTSKTCTKCGCWQPDLELKKLYECKYCGLKINRDKNGARNNLLEKLQELIVNVVNFARRVRRRVN